MPIVSVDENPRDGREEQRWYLTAETDDSKKQCLSRESVDQPARRDARDPRADERYALSAEEETIVSVPQRTKQPRALLIGHGIDRGMTASVEQVWRRALVRLRLPRRSSAALVPSRRS